jgi:tetratricopeptide (TPR) repeat protein
LKSLSRICREYRDFTSAIKLLKKALQYSWENNSFDEEIEIYEELGICYYYTGEIETAQFYHQKFVTGDTERLDSPNRQMSLNDLIICRRKLLYNFDNFNKIIFY